MTRTRMACVAVALLGGCAAGPESHGSGGAGGTGGAGGGGSGQLAVPFTLSDYFAPSGYMGDGMQPGNINAETSTGACAPRPPGAKGDCYKFTYTPKAQLWAGVYWQYPANNWGAMPGKMIAPGATKVHFRAAAGVGGVMLTVLAGGIHDAMLPNHDDFKVQKPIALTTTLSEYTIDLTGQTYNTVIGGFAWTVMLPAGTDPATAPPIVLYFDDIEWE